MKERIATCADCYWFDKRTKDGKTATICRRYSPSRHGGYWRSVRKSDWCGEYFSEELGPESMSKVAGEPEDSLPTLEQFLATAMLGKTFNYRSFIQADGFEHLYVRYRRNWQFSPDGGSVDHILDIAKVETVEKGKGVFTVFYENLRRRYPRLTIYVECVQNERFGRYLQKLGFDPVGPMYPQCFIKYAADPS